MSYRTTYLLFRGISFACLAGAQLVFVTIFAAPRHPDATHIYLYKGEYLTVEQARGFPLLLGAFMFCAAISEIFRYLDMRSVGKSKYFW